MEIEIIVAFEAYPAGESRRFSAGETVSDLTKECAALYVAKGLAAEVEEAPALAPRARKDLARST